MHLFFSLCSNINKSGMIKKGEINMHISRLYITMICTYLFYTSCFCMDSTITTIRKDIHQARKDIGTIVAAVAPHLGQAIRGEDFVAIENNPYKNIDAQVRKTHGISDGEKKYLTQRFPIVKASLEKFLTREISNHQVLNIALIHSGGGYRAMESTTGFLRGVEKIGLLGAATYVVGLSGSTGAIAPWISTQMPLKKFKDYIKNCVAQSFTHPTDEQELLIYETAAVKTYFKQPKSPVDLYGDLLGNRLLEHFGEKRHMVYLSEQAKIIESGAYPYPIYTAIDATETKEVMRNPTWYGFTPHEVEDHRHNMHIPIWAWGRKFKDGTSRTGKHHTIYPPQKNICYILGMCWSAFGAPMNMVKKEIGKALAIEHFLETAFTSLDARRLDFYAKVPNYTYKLEHTKKNEPKLQYFVDAGTHVNIPVLPVSGLCKERKADVMIICDASAGPIGEELREVVKYMEEHNLPFPKINFKNIGKKTIHVFKEEDPNVPVVIYMPGVSDQALYEANKLNPKFAKYSNLSNFDFFDEANNGFLQTKHFYTAPDNSQKAMALWEFNVCVNKPKFIEALQYAIDRKK